MSNPEVTAKINALIRKNGSAYFVIADGCLYFIPAHHKYIYPESDAPRELVTKTKLPPGWRYYYEAIRKFK